MHFNSIPLIVFLIIHRLSFLFGANIICYYPNWAFYRPDEYKMKIADLNAGLCTHAIYAFVGMHQENYTLKSTDTWADYDNNGFKDFAALKNVYPKLKIVIGVGGWGESNDGTAKFSKLAASSENTAAFIASVIKFLKDYNFDGVDFSWQFPPEADKANHAKLMSAIKSAFEPHGYLLSAAVSASTLKVEKAYDLAELSKSTDFISVLAYDLRGSWDDQADHHAPLRKRPGEKTNNNVESVIDYFIAKGYPASKINLGIPLHSSTWTLSSDVVEPPAPALGPGAAGPMTRSSGTLGYTEICSYVKYGGWKVYRDPTGAMGPYAVSPGGVNRTWVGYDDPEMAAVKANYTLSKGLGGVMIWEITLDDPRNACGDGPYPVLTAINEALSVGQASSSNDASSTRTTSADAHAKAIKMAFISSFACLLLFLL